MASDLVGAAEIAALLGVSRQRVDQLSRHQDFPEPIAELASGRIWSRKAIEEWAQALGRDLQD
jgi:predicted DNA-binding transcriptional regulator AlpA